MRLSRANGEVDGIVRDQRAEAAGQAARLEKGGLGGQDAALPDGTWTKPRARPFGRGLKPPPGRAT
jgi:hypothetical protein